MKVTLNGVQVHPAASSGGVLVSGKTPQPPAGPIPLHAMGHNPIIDDDEKGVTKLNELLILEIVSNI